ncbi:type II toxin-antitoxin system RelE/ParE family toxin [Vibrio cholerae]|uniref:type II toxin-antitoxin system RelE/ParE family toxin n=1 Tax=Vibrio cholerae TaxID=666 RepID=UPI000E0A4EAA|nr:type II toxin-antitoxin system RelE/ParE family toxin [Vibrio cholerae]EGQ8122547.1 type II toxin-antitoxin system RelE/ParE family toxin [Vibrio cholerae]EJL6637471.1 type II toxin-antitoxin system RelE/ParE family toxin [Vibrio cholerae]EKO6518002.1 type II toxin-antitoxin system RelE/ParE family toxin [Vibrio cholerae]TXY25570.1 type II toxin-antitoxin system RelE/ParE family toxin [Vibrio cholerae]
MLEKKVRYHGDSEKCLLAFPKQIIECYAQDLEFLRYGLQPLSKVKPMKGLGKGVCELKRNGKPAYRLVYVIVEDVIHVLHAFSKTSDGTDKKHENTIKIRFGNL